MKKKLSILTLGLLLTLTACGGGSDPTETPTNNPTETPTVTPTETPTENPTETPTETPVEKMDYTVTVKYEDGNPATGVRVQCCTLDNSLCLMPEAVDENGTVVLNLEINSYVVHLFSVPEDYFYDEDGYVLTPTTPTVEVTLYSVKEVGRQR